MDRSQIALFAFLFICFSGYSQKNYSVSSPSEKIKVSISVEDSVFYSLEVNGQPVIVPSAIALVTQKNKLGINARVKGFRTRSVNQTIINPVPFKRKIIPDHFNELTIDFRDNSSLIFRAYDDGVAYRFQTRFRDSVQVNQEVATFRFHGDGNVYFSEVQKREHLDAYHTSFEEPYKIVPLATISPDQLSFTPLLVDENSVKVVITESDLLDYPGMFLKGTHTKKLIGSFAAYPRSEEIQGGEFKQPVVTERHNFLAKTSGTRVYPWRVIAIAEKDGDLLMNDLVYRLASPPTNTDWSWVKPGISTEEWICGSNLYGVNFKAGINTATYKYYIDFASRFGMQYVMLDAGWSDYNDLSKITPGLDLEEVAAYASTKNIQLILWTLSMTLDRQLDTALKEFNRLGIRAIMTDFMDRDDQKTVRFYKRIAEATARHKIMVMFHGAFKNAGFERTYPNAITREGVLGSEYNIWSDKASPEHDLLIPFIRMVSGPMDYEPGFYRNANQRSFRPLPDMVMSQGTRTHQLAMFVAYESPIQMFSGNPSDAYPEIAFTTYLASLPTTWDDTRVIDAKLGDYLVIARRKDNDWYLSAMTDWSEREMEVSLSFLGDGKYRAFSCEDGTNAKKDASDYRMGYKLTDNSEKLEVKMAPGGGYVVKLIKLEEAKP